MGAIFPAPTARSATAVPGVGDEHDDNVYSALVLAHGGVGTQTIFLAGQGQPIPALASSTITAANIPAHYQTYTPQTTPIQQSGQLGNTIGGFSVRAIGVTIDQAIVSGGVPRAYGATAVEVIDILSKVCLEVKLSSKRRIVGPAWSFPQVGGPMGFTTATATSFVQNGMLPSGRRIASRFEIARQDVLTVDLNASAALSFSDTSFATTHAGQATLVWVMMIGTARSDVR